MITPDGQCPGGGLLDLSYAIYHNIIDVTRERERERVTKTLQSTASFVDISEYAERIVGPTPNRNLRLLISKEEEPVQTFKTFHISPGNVTSKISIQYLFEDVAQIKLQIADLISDRMEFN